MLQVAIKRLLAQRRGGHRVPAGQGLLFPEAPSFDAPKAEEAETDLSDEAGDGDDSPQTQSGKDNKKRSPRKIDTTGLPRQDRLHDVPEDQRVDAVTGQPLVQISEKVFEETRLQTLSRRSAPFPRSRDPRSSPG
jgi:hypothetical protein